MARFESLVRCRGVTGNGSSHGNGIPMGFPREWELEFSKDGNGNTTTWEWKRLMPGPIIIPTA